MGNSKVSSVKAQKQTFSQSLHQKFLKNKQYSQGSCRFQKLVRQEFLRRVEQSKRDRLLNSLKPKRSTIEFVKAQKSDDLETLPVGLFNKNEGKKILPPVKDLVKFSGKKNALRTKLRRKNKILRRKNVRLLAKDNEVRSSLLFLSGVLSLIADLIGTGRYLFILCRFALHDFNEDYALDSLVQFEWISFKDTAFSGLYEQIKNYSTKCFIFLCYVAKLVKSGREEISVVQLTDVIEQYNDLEHERFQIDRSEIVRFYQDEFVRSVLNRLARSPKGELLFSLLQFNMTKHLAKFGVSDLGNSFFNTLRTVPFIGTILASADLPRNVLRLFREVRKLRKESVLTEDYQKFLKDLRIDGAVTSPSSFALRDLTSIESVLESVQRVGNTAKSINTQTHDMLLMYKSAAITHYNLAMEDRSVEVINSAFRSVGIINRLLRLPKEDYALMTPEFHFDFSRGLLSTLNRKLKLKIMTSPTSIDEISGSGDALAIILERFQIRPENIVGMAFDAEMD